MTVLAEEALFWAARDLSALSVGFTVIKNLERKMCVSVTTSVDNVGLGKQYLLAQ